MINFLTYRLLILFSILIGFFNRSFIIQLGKFLGSILFYILPIRKKVAKINLKIAFPDLNKQQINLLIKQTYQHYSILLFDFLRQKNRFNKMHIIVDEKTKYILSKKSGKIFMTGHIGNWEIILPFIGQYTNMMGVAREQNNKGADKFIKECRLHNNISLISNKGSVKKMITALNNHYMLMLVCDQNAKSLGNKVNFFNKSASIPKGPGLFYYKTKADLLFGFCVLNKNWDYEFKLEEIKIKNNSEQKEDIIIEVNRVYSNMLENIIRKYPEQYFWFHKKWDKNLY